jgi:glutamate dehydrogenase/leucine dehydrogenase
MDTKLIPLSFWRHKPKEIPRRKFSTKPSSKYQHFKNRSGPETRLHQRENFRAYRRAGTHHHLRVPWQDDNAACTSTRFPRAVQQRAGPYKGGMRFHETVTQDVLKFLGFEQVLKTVYHPAFGGGKGGSDFDTRGKSDSEVMRFAIRLSTSFTTTSLSHRHSGGDLGCGAREIAICSGNIKNSPTILPGVYRQKAQLGRQSAAPGSHRLRRGVLCAEYGWPQGRQLKRQNMHCLRHGNVGIYAIEKLPSGREVSGLWITPAVFTTKTAWTKKNWLSSKTWYSSAAEA